MRAFAIAVALTIVGTAPAAAQKQTPPNHNVGDPNERICEKLTLVGSRLATKRVCATRAEWAERKRLDREAVDKAQMGAHIGCSTNGTHTGAPSC